MTRPSGYECRTYTATNTGPDYIRFYIFYEHIEYHNI